MKMYVHIDGLLTAQKKVHVLHGNQSSGYIYREARYNIRVVLIVTIAQLPDRLRRYDTVM